jgi:hypothetical protein
MPYYAAILAEVKEAEQRAKQVVDLAKAAKSGLTIVDPSSGEVIEVPVVPITHRTAVTFTPPKG